MRSGLTGFESVFQLFRVEFATNEHHPAFALFAGFPRALVITFDDHVDPLHYISVVVAVKGDNALQAENVRTVELGYLLDPRKELSRIDRPRAQ